MENKSAEDVRTGDEELFSSDKKRHIMRKVNLIYVGINFVLGYCSRCTPTRSSTGDNISVHAHFLRVAFCFANVLKSILKRYMVQSYALKLYPEINVSELDRRVSCDENRTQK